MRFNIGEQVELPREHINTLGNNIGRGVIFDAIDTSQTYQTEGIGFEYGRYQLRIDEVGEEGCRCTVLERLR